MRVTDCECTGPGWCERHKCYKSLMFYRACGRTPQLFAMWEQGRGPGQRRAQTADKPRRQPCKHRTKVLRTVQCPTCRGQVDVKVFACHLHEECSVGKQVGDRACCATCRDYEANDSTSG